MSDGPVGWPAQIVYKSKQNLRHSTSVTFISPVLQSQHQILQSIRQREIVKSTDQITSGNRFASDAGTDSGALRISTKFAAEAKISNAVSQNLQNAFHVVQHQAAVLKQAELAIMRMNELAYNASDVMSSSVDRRAYDMEFQALVSTLNDLISDETFGDDLLDQLQSNSIEIIEGGGSSGGFNVEENQVQDFGALGGKIDLWWNPQWARDRIRIYQGDRWFFDSGEYRSDAGEWKLVSGNWQWDSNIREETMEDGTLRYGDKFTIEFGPNQISVTPDSNNEGNADGMDIYLDNDGDGLGDDVDADGYSDYQGEQVMNGYPRWREPLGDSSTLKFVVNEPGDENVVRPITTIWDYHYKIEKDDPVGPSGIKNSGGDVMFIRKAGFSVLEGYDLTTRQNASEAMNATQDELESLRYQLGKLAETFSHLRFNAERNQSREKTINISQASITDTDVAEKQQS